jgi:hypothetical protein
VLRTITVFVNINLQTAHHGLLIPVFSHGKILFLSGIQGAFQWASFANKRFSAQRVR